MILTSAIVAVTAVVAHKVFDFDTNTYQFVRGDSPYREKSFEPFDPLLQNTKSKEAVKDLHVVFSNHLDLGFNVRAWCDGDDGCTSTNQTKTGLPCRPWAFWVMNENINVFLPRAAQTAANMSASGSDRYIYMTQPWVASFYENCDNTGMNDWRNAAGGNGNSIVECPSNQSRALFKEAIANGDIFFQAFPHNAQPGTYDSSLFEASLDMAAHLADSLGARRPGTFSQRDETGMTRAILPLLKKHNISMISLGSGGSSGGHPVIPDLFVWRDASSDSDVIFTFDHGYGGGTHILPNGVALYCAWNTDNSGPQSPASAMSIYENLRKHYPSAKVHASTFDDFSAVAQSVKHLLPVVTQEIGDTWLYGVPSDPLKNVWFREFSRLRRKCVDSGDCNPTTPAFRNFDRLMTKIPEHTWGEDTTWYLHDYDNWTNAQINEAMLQDNYNMTVESWREQRSYLINAPGVLKAEEQHSKFAQSLEEAFSSLADLTIPPNPANAKQHEGSTTSIYTCEIGNENVDIAFGTDGAISSLVYKKHDWADSSHLGRFTYQTISADNFTTFCEEYGNSGCKDTTENPGCHNFHKPNMSSANPNYHEVVPQVSKLYHSADECAFSVQSIVKPPTDGVTYGPPKQVWTRVEITSASSDGLQVAVTINWVNKTTTRLAEATWVSFAPNVQSSSSGWSILNLDTLVDPTDVVQHGAVHLHSIGADGGMIYSGPEGNMSIYSLDAPVVSCGVLSPFPTPGDNSTLNENMSNGMMWNLQNNIWNTNYPQWYPFEGVYGYGTQSAGLGLNAAFRFNIHIN